MSSLACTFFVSPFIKRILTNSRSSIHNYRPDQDPDLSSSQSFINSLLADPSPMRTPQMSFSNSMHEENNSPFHLSPKKDSLVGTLAGAQAGGDMSFEFSGEELDDEDDELMIQTTGNNFAPVKEIPQGNAFASLPSQMAAALGGEAVYATPPGGGPRKKRKHVEEEEVSFSLNTEHDPQRLVSTATIPNDLFATEIPVSNFSNFSGVQPKIEPLTPFTPPTPQTPQTPNPASTPTFPTSSVTKPESTAQNMLNQVHAMQIQQKGTFNFIYLFCLFVFFLLYYILVFSPDLLIRFFTKTEQLLKLHQIQRKLMLQPGGEVQHFKAVDAEHRQMKAKIEEELAFLQTIFGTHLLEPPELHKHAFLKQDLELQLKQVEIYHRELTALLQNGGPRWFACLF